MKTHITPFAKSLLLIPVCLALLAAQALSHTFTVQSTRYVVTGNSSKPMLLGWGHYLPLDDGVHGKKIKFLNVIDPNGTKNAITPQQVRGLHSYMIDYDKPGTWALAADTNPGFYTIYTDKNGKEHHSLKPKAKVRRAVSISMSRYSSQSSKAYVRCGENGEPFQPITGLDLELVPQTNPTLLKTGQSLKLTAYYRGKHDSREGTWDFSHSDYSRKANAWYISGQKAPGGEFSVTPDREGIWFVRYQLIRPAEGDELKDCNDFSHKTTLVFQVGPGGE